MHPSAPATSTTTTRTATPRTHLRIGRWRFSAMELLIALVLLFVLAPFLESLPHGRTIEGALMTLVLVSAGLAIGGRRRSLLLTAVLAAPAILAKWLHHFRPNLFPETAYYAAAILFLAFVIVNLLRFALTAPRVNTEVLCAGISAYLLLGLLWSLAYSIEARVHPGAFVFNMDNGADATMSHFTAFYFSFVTLSTVGYGDITPASPVARMLAVTEAMTGMLYIGVLIARLVALYSVPVNADSSNEP